MENLAGGGHSTRWAFSGFGRVVSFPPMTDPDTTLTDFLLAAVAAGLAVWAFSQPFGGAHGSLFAALGVAAFTGGIWHGWFAGQERGGLGGAIWLATLLAVGAANTALWLIVADMRLGIRGILTALAVAQFAFFAALVVFIARRFWLASAFGLPAVLAVLAAHGLALSNGGPEGPAQPGLWFAIAGLTLALLGAVIQVRGLGLHRVGLGHNAVYHLVETVALILMALSLPSYAALLSKG